MRRKLATYSLDKTHDDGGPKARGFELILGITIQDIDYLEAVLRAGILVTPISAVRMRAPYGVHCEVRVPVRGLGVKRHRTIDALTGWEHAAPRAAPRMTTAYLRPQ